MATIEEYVAEVQKQTNEMHEREYKNVPSPIVSYETGKRYHRIVLSDPRDTSRSVHSFVEVATGNILKAASWKSPAKGVRGNISDLSKGFGPNGAWYYR